jgi:endo-1,3-1,4-beta-glycanase ExoK
MTSTTCLMTRSRKLRRATLLLIGLAALPATAQQAVAPKSFFDPFDRIDSKRWYISDGWVNGDIQGCTWAKSNVTTQNGMLHLQLTKAANRLRAYKCAEIRTYSRYGYGLYEVRMRTAAGAGLNTAMFTYSGKPLTPVHDEVDFEFLGKSPKTVQLNYFVAGKGGHETLAPVGADASVGFHTYAFDWGPQQLRWYIDGKLVRTAAALPQPSVAGQYFLTLWMGGAPADGWLGKFVDARPSISADVDWVAFTAPGERCAFAQSLSCTTH